MKTVGELIDALSRYDRDTKLVTKDENNIDYNWGDAFSMFILSLNTGGD